MRVGDLLGVAVAASLLSCSQAPPGKLAEPGAAQLPGDLWHATTLLDHRFVTFRYCEPTPCWTESYLEWLSDGGQTAIRVPVTQLQTGFVNEAYWDSGPKGQVLVAVVDPLEDVIDPTNFLYGLVRPIEPGAYEYGVAEPSPWESGQLREYTGSYRSGFEVSEFVPDGFQQRWWLSGDLSGLPRSEAAVRISVRGLLSRPGGWGHFGQYDRELTVVSSRVLSN